MRLWRSHCAGRAEEQFLEILSGQKEGSQHVRKE